MFLLILIQDYFVWHYTRAWWELWGVWRNYLWFIIHFFSMPQLIASLFAPFKRITEGRGRSFSVEDIAGYILINILSRFIGACIRLVLLAIGFMLLSCCIVFGFGVYLVWALLPFIMVWLIIWGSALIYTGI